MSNACGVMWPFPVAARLPYKVTLRVRVWKSAKFVSAHYHRSHVDVIVFGPYPAIQASGGRERKF